MSKCLLCGEETRNVKFCSQACSKIGQVRSARKTDHTKTCLSCGESFQYSKDPSQKFCSRSCSATYNNRLTPKRVAAPGSRLSVVRAMGRVECICGAQLKDGYRYCSRNCVNQDKRKINNENRIRTDRVVELGECLYCGEDIPLKNKYCSQECSSLKKRTENIEAWLKDPSTGNTQQGLKSSIRSYLIDEAGHKCSRCGWDKVHSVTGKVPLEVDHKDGDCYNNHPDNLQVLCPSCHSLTATYGASNRNGQRAYRRRKNISLP